MALKYKVGDRVRIRSIDWYNENKDEHGNINISHYFTFYAGRSKYCGKVFTIDVVFDDCYSVKEDNHEYYWIDEMIEGLVETPKFKKGDFVNGAEWADKTNALELFKKLPHLDYLYGVQTDWKYTPSLHHFDGAWHVTWIECEEGDSIKDFKAETPEEAIKKAFDWCVKLKLIGNDTRR